MLKLERFVDHPFKRRRRRQNTGCFLLFCAVSKITAFVPLPFNRPSTDSVFDILNVLREPCERRRGLFSLLRAVPDGSDGDGKSFRIPPEQLALIKESADIVSVIESYDLPGFQRQGNNRAKAICPFHDDHNPSMSVDGQRGIYKCFACGAGGDVFSFVREYGEIKGEPMTFYQAVRHVAQKFGDPKLKLDFVSSSQPRMSDSERKALNEKKQRLLLANAAAAAFYAKCLIALPAAGVARSHIQERGLSPTTVKAFAMGYAPDAYFRVKGEWGTGGLVHHLRDLGFKPSEIIEAGLATRTKGAEWNSAPKQKNPVNVTTDEVDENDNDYNTLIDRFRNRLMVPIFDSRGTNVLGFGARILPPEETDASGYKLPKYVNSPESPVFQKKNVLFGQHYASEAAREMRRPVAGPERGSIVIVEGYMDAVSLWEAGIHEVVASMGTALTTEQLASAARTAGTHGGRIVLCFDGDEAGSNAIERLCSGSLLSKTTETYVVEIFVATLPSNIKDPSEYIESRSSKNKIQVGDEFRKDVIDTAKDWTAWYLDKLLSRYDDGALRATAGSFADICDRVSEFLSRFPNPAERTKRAHDVAGSLADIVSGKTDSAEGSNALRIQLETDLVNMVARKAGMRESIERRIESVEGYSADSTKQKLAKMTGGGGVSSPDDDSKLSARALRALKPSPSSKYPVDEVAHVRRDVSRRKSFDKDGGYRARRRRAPMQRSSKKLVQPPFTPHFSGFDFENLSDVDWLNLPREKWKRKKSDLTLGTAKEGRRYVYVPVKAVQAAEDQISGLRLDDLVYFNSNDYHGQQFLTEEALDAGYCNVEVARDATIFERGVGTLVRQDAHTLVDAAEENLLRNIVKSGRARMAMIHCLASSDATGSENQIEWSRPERAWLFDYLMTKSHLIPTEILSDGRMQDLRNYLAGLPNAPPGAFVIDLTVSRDSESGTTIDRDSVDMISGARSNADIPSLGGSHNLEARMEISNSAVESAVDIGGSIDEANTPLDSDDIETWAASYDPSMLDDANYIVNVKEAVQQDALPPVEVEYMTQDMEVSFVNGEITPGSLDIFFVSEEDLFAETCDNSVSRELRAELEVQEAHVTLLRAYALKQLAAVKEEWLSIGRVLSARLDEEDSVAETGNTLPETSTAEAARASDGVIDLNSMSIDDLKEHCKTVAGRLRDITETAHHLDVSSKRIVSRLMDYSNADGIEGRLSVAQQEELASMVDKHVESLPENWKAPEMSEVGNIDRSHNNRDPMLGWGDDFSLERVESFEDDMAEISEDWGEWADDGFVWSPEDDLDSVKLSTRAASSALPNALEMSEFEPHEEDHESLEEALHRLDSDWSYWDNDNVEAPLNIETSNNLGDNLLTDGDVAVESFEDAADVDDTTAELRDYMEPDFDSIFE